MPKRKPKRPRAVKVHLIKPPEKILGKGSDPANPYTILETIRREHHLGADRMLDDARVALAWMYDVKPDKDDHVVLGKCKKASDLDREFRDYDFVILLNKIWWDKFDAKQRAALIDHELSHAAVCVDREGEYVKDERGRNCYRTRKHDVEEFRDVIKRHGLYKADLVDFAREIYRREKIDKPLWSLVDDEGEKKSEGVA